MRHIVPACLLLAALIHLLPVAGVLGAERLATLYGLTIEEPNLLILMRHRAVLFGIVGGLLMYAVFEPGVRGVAWVAGLVSVLSFLVLAGSIAGHNAPLARVVLADWIALAALTAGAAAQTVQPLRSA